jgi:hypothetical protein
MAAVPQQLIMDCVVVPNNSQAYQLSDLLTTATLGVGFAYLALTTHIMLDAGSGNSKLYVGTSSSTGASHYGLMLYADQISIPITTVGCAPGVGIYLATDNVAGVTVGVNIGPS